MIIKDGYNGQPLEIRISSQVIIGQIGDRSEIWIEMFQPDRKPDSNGRIETLHYATIEEIRQLRDACNQTLEEMLGL